MNIRLCISYSFKKHTTAFLFSHREHEEYFYQSLFEEVQFGNKVIVDLL